MRVRHDILGVGWLAILAIAVPLPWSGVAWAEQPYPIAWIAQIGTTSSDLSRSVAVDGAGNAYISGNTAGSLGGPNGSNSTDAFLVKFDQWGVELWSQQIGTTAIDESLSVAVDGAGNVYISGETWGSLGGPNAGFNDAFLAKFSIAGDLNFDGFVGIDDINIILTHWNEDSGVGNPQIGDLTGDGFVGLDDLNRVIVNWNNGTPPLTEASAVVPEPGTLAVLALGVPVLLRRR